MTVKEFWNNKPLRNKTILISIIVLLAISFLFQRGYIGLDYFNKAEKEKQAEIERLIKERDSLQKVYIHDIDSISKIKSEINSYYDDYIREKREADRLQKQIDNIHYSVYGRKQLDSTAEYVKYK